MTREEETKEAYKDYMNNGGMFQSNPWFYFKAGTEWADEHPNLESLWHNPSEEPLLEETEFIFINEQDFAYISKRNVGGAFSYTLVDYAWEGYVNTLKIKKWAYISDLLPKGGEQ